MARRPEHLPPREVVVGVLDRPLTKAELKAALWHAWGRDRQVEITDGVIDNAVDACRDAVVQRYETRELLRGATKGMKHRQRIIVYERAT